MEAEIRWNDAGLVPAIVQDASTRRILMLAWMNREALERTLRTGTVHFFSRSRQTLWRKGETSGNELRLVSLASDCDRDALLVTAEPAGPTCHTDETSCFFRPLAGDSEAAAGAPALDAALGELARVVHRRARTLPEGSYTTRLLEAGPRRAAQKVGEEGVEVALAGAAGTDRELVDEAADLLYHLLVLFESRSVPPGRIAAELARRRRPARTDDGPTGG